MSGGWSVSVDRGGTFTDIVATGPSGERVVRKVPSHGDGRELAAIVEITSDRLGSLRCGTTVATNALLERRGEPFALFVTRGFGDLLRIGTGARPDLFSLRIEKPEPLAKEIVEVAERVLADGTVRVPLDEAALRDAAARVRLGGIETAAVLFMHSYAFPEHERRAAEILRECGFEHVSLSHAVAPEVRALPRAETASADAYLTPMLHRSLDRYRAAVAGPELDLRFMQSDGNLTDVEHASGPRAVLSGPAGGVLATGEIARLAGVPNAIGFDMGGTSTDVCRFSGEAEREYETRVAGVRLRVPSLRIVTVAAGGGSRLHFDGRRLRVGPDSAGAWPGPAGYGGEGPAAITDANAVLGRILPERFPRCFGPHGGEPFDADLSRAAVAELAERAGLDLHAAAAGFMQVAVERMAQAIREVSVARGHDVRDHALVCFGGAGAQHACSLARALDMRRVLLHPLGSVLSAWGISLARAGHESAAAVLATWDEAGRERALAVCNRLATDARERLISSGITANTLRTFQRVDLRYRGGDHTMDLALGGNEATARLFHLQHRKRFGFAMHGRDIEIVSVRVRVVERESARAAAPAESSVPRAVEASSSVTCWFETAHAGLAAVDTPVFELAELVSGDTFDGPALAVDDVTTVVVEPGWRARVDPCGLLVLDAVEPVPLARRSTERDPVFLALFGNAFMSIAERMGAVLERVSHSTNIKERLDFSCALFDHDGRLVANAPHIPVHLGAMGESVRAIGGSRNGTFVEGDCYVTNDPFRGGSHLPDVTIVTPVLVADGIAAYYVASRAHHADVGGITPGSMPPLSRTIDDEGVRVHDVLLQRRGVFDEAAARAAFAGSRGMQERIADLRAQCAASAVGRRLLGELVEQHGDDVVRAYMGHVLDDGAEAMSEMLAALPDGEHHCEDALDDGTPLRVRVEIRGDRAVVDFAGTGPQSAENLNAPRAVTRAAVLFSLRALIDRDVPLNEGCLRPVEIRIPEGSLLAPSPPAAVVGGNVETSMRVVDVVLGALGAVAASQGTMNNLTFGLRASDEGRSAYYETIPGGSGAGPDFDGASAVQVHMTNTRITDPEIVELRWPVVVRRFAIRRGSGGAGAQRGGDGTIREIEFLEPMEGGILSQRRTSGAFALQGGSAGTPGRNVHIRAGEERDLPGRAALDLRAGDILRIETPGGGGYGAVSP